VSARRYRFDPLEQRGVVGPLRAGQVVILALAAGLALAAVYLLPGFPGLASALALLGAAGAAVALPVEGRTVEQWAPVALRWGLRHGEERHGFRAALPFEGGGARQGEREETDLSLPGPLRGLAMLQVPYGADHVGVLHDRASGTYTAALSVRAGAFGLCDSSEQERKLAAWGSALAGLARDGSPVRRVQWVERTLPAGGDELAAYLQENRDPAVPMSSGLVSSYIELIESAAPASQEHEVLIALQVSERLAGREMRRLGGGEQAACELLLREMEGLAERLSLAEITVAGLLRSGEYSRTIRDAFDPFGRQARARAALVRGEDDAPRMGPLADETGWSHYRSDSAVHSSYWISSWPRTDVGPSFMAPLLMGASGLRTVSVVIEPVPYSLALRRAEAARTAEVAEEIQRERQGFLTTARIRRRQQATARREEELADGHAEMRAAGFITTHERSVSELERREPETLHAAQLAQLELQPLYGEQAAGMTFGLPICRGLR
jgi:hypothetical protein